MPEHGNARGLATEDRLARWQRHSRIFAKPGRKRKALPTIEVYAAKLIRECGGPLTPSDGILTRCSRLFPFLDDMDKKQAGALAVALEKMLERDTRGVRGVARTLRMAAGLWVHDERP